MIDSDALRLQLVQDIINLPDDLVPLVRDFLAELNDEEPTSNDSSNNGGNDEQYTDVKSPTGDRHRQPAE